MRVPAALPQIVLPAGHPPFAESAGEIRNWLTHIILQMRMTVAGRLLMFETAGPTSLPCRARTVRALKS